MLTFTFESGFPGKKYDYGVQDPKKGKKEQPGKIGLKIFRIVTAMYAGTEKPV